MKHNAKITAILLIMFFVTQLIGLFVIYRYMPKDVALPYGFEPPEMSPGFSLINIFVAMVVAIVLIFALMRIRAELFLRLWFFVVIVIAISITFSSVVMGLFPYSNYIVILAALPLAFFKIFRRNLLVHNITELLVYPGLASVFVPILNLWSIIVLLLLISAYDIYAVWHSGFMQKMVKFQINNLKIFAGFFIPYLGKRQREELKKIKNQKFSKLKQKKIKVNLAILGGGDVVFPIITSGVVFTALGFVPALIVSIFATLSLLVLFVFAKKGKFYPAMPFLTAGLFVGMIVGYLVKVLLL